MSQSKQRRTVNPIPFIANRADPYILRHVDGRYYYTASVPEYDRIMLRSADSLDGLRSAPETVVWSKHDSGDMSYHIWAPELHWLDGVWYLYFAAGRADDIWHIRPYVLQCRGSDPLSAQWRESGIPKRKDNFSFNDFSLDMTVFTHAGRRYAVWAEKVNTGRKISNLYIAEMETPLSLKTQQVLLATPSYDWERIGFWVNEGPAFISSQSKLCITYSASETGADYCIGLLWADVDSDLLDPQSWHKERQPILETCQKIGLYGPGHNSFFHDKNGNTVCAYHARTYKNITGDPLNDPNRHTYLMPVSWRNGLPVLDYDAQSAF